MTDSLELIAESGDRRRILEALRQKLAAAIDGCSEAKDLAALSLRLEKVTAELQAIGPPRAKELSFEERLAARREARQTANG